MVTNDEIKAWIEAGLEDSEAQVSGDGHHFDAVVICRHFAGKNSLQRHRLVYQALGDKLKSTIHALSLKTLTPEEAG